MVIKKCIKCGKLKEHKARGYCLECYRKVHNKEYYQKNINKIRKYYSLTKKCKICRKEIQAKSKHSMGNLKYCDECNKKLKRKRAKESMRERRKKGIKPKRRKAKCRLCKEKKEIFAKGMCNNCYNRVLRQDKSKEKIECPICGGLFIQLTSHLKVHNITINEFKKKYPKVLLTKDLEHGVLKFIKEKGRKAFIERQIKAGKKNIELHREETIKRMFEGNKKFFANMTEEERKVYRAKLGLSAIESLRKNKPFYWKGVPFDSNEEKEVAKLLLKEPIKGVNCHIIIDSTKAIDFFPQQKVFVEYHPNPLDRGFKRKKPREEYMSERIEVLSNNKYKDKPIEFIFDQYRTKKGKEKVIKKIKEIKERYNL